MLSPEPDVDGWVTLRDGTQIDTNAPGNAQTASGMERYNGLKFQHEFNVKQQQDAASGRAAEEKLQSDAAAAQAALVQQEQTKRADTYVADRYALPRSND